MTETVKHGPVQIRVNQRGDGRWFFKRKVGGCWRSVASVDKKKVLDEAKATARLIVEQRAGVLALNSEEVSEFLKWKAEQGRAVSVMEALEQYQASKLQNEMSPQHRRAITKLTEHLRPCAKFSINAVQPAEIDEILRSLTDQKGRPVGPRRKNNVRDDLIAFFRWCRRRRLLPEEQTAPERVDPFPEPPPSKEYFSVDELRRLIAACDEEWISWLVIGAFAGLRPEEIQRLDWSSVLWIRRFIDVRADTSKTKRRRLVPIQDNLARWLSDHLKPEGPVVPGRIDNYVRQLRRRAGVNWPNDGLRHSYGSYRLAVLQDVGKLAEEMGNSPAIIRRHYAEAVFPNEGKEWFEIAPKCTTGKQTPVPICPAAA